MLNSQFVSSFSISSLAQALSAPYTSFSAYNSGLIDANGNILKPEGSFNSFEYFVIKLKKIFEELPTSSTKIKLQNYSTAYQLFTEDVQKFGIDKNQYIFFIEGCLEARLLAEDMTTGSAPGSLGVPTQANNIGGVQGFDPRLGEIPQTALGNLHMFDVSPEEFESFKKAKAWKNIKDGETKRYLQRFQRRNPNGKIALRTKNADKEKHDLHWITYTPKSFMEEYNLSDLPILHENIKTSKNGQTAADVVGTIASKIGVQQNYDLGSLNSSQTEYVGRMIDWVNGFHAASMSGEEGHAEEWIQLGANNAGKKASTNDSAGPEAEPDGYRYDSTAKSTNFKDRVIKVDYGTDRKPVSELSRKKQGIVVGGEMLSLPFEKTGFKTAIRELIADPSMQTSLRSEMQRKIDMPQTILHTRTTGPRLPKTSTGFVSHEPEQLKQIVKSRQFNINPQVGKPTSNEPMGRQTVQSLDLRVRSTSSPSVGNEMGYDEIRSIPGGDAPKEAISVSQDALDHLMDNIPDGPNKDSLVHHVSSILGPHLKRGRYPLELPSSKVITT